MNVFISSTEVPHVLKFVLPETVPGSFEWTKEDDPSISPMATQILQFPFVERVYLTANFVAIAKNDLVEWDDIADELKQLINEHYENKTIIKDEQQLQPFTLYVEMTPNPDVMKFVSNQLLSKDVAEFTSKENAPEGLVSFLFDLPEVKEVFITENYISLTRIKGVDWHEIANDVRVKILDYLQKGGLIFPEGFSVSAPQHPTLNQVDKKAFTDIEKKIQNILEEYIKPAVSSDGGNIELVKFEEETKTATMLLQGACSGCPSSTITLKNGIETMLKQMLPNEVEQVEAING